MPINQHKRTTVGFLDSDYLIVINIDVKYANKIVGRTTMTMNSKYFYIATEAF